MKRFHVHVSVNDLAESIRFYSTVFGRDPTVRQADYAKWMLEDPKVNFAVSNRGHEPGLNHLGFQVDSADELTGMKAQLEAADAALTEQKATSCCYARSDKYWVTDPAGIAWETFHTLGSVPVYGEDGVGSSSESGCCIPLAPAEQADKGAACCVPSQGASASPCCQ